MRPYIDASYSDYRYLLGVLINRPRRVDGVDADDAASTTSTALLGAVARLIICLQGAEGI